MMDTKVLLSALSAGLLATTATAQLGQLDSSSFSFLYEMDVDPSDPGSIDLDANGGEDFFGGVAAGFVIPSVSGGIATSNQANGETLFRTDFGDSTAGSIQRTSILGDMTIEVSVWINSDGNGRADVIEGTEDPVVGYFGFALDQVSNGPNSMRVNIDADNVSFNFAGIDPIATADNTDGFHTFRIAYDLDDSDPLNLVEEYYIWRDDVLLNPDLNTPFAPSDNNFNGPGAFFIGDFTSSLDGEWQLDYIRIDNTGAYAPVSAAIPGDADGDGDIDDTDLGIAISNFTGPVGGAGGKTAADGDTDGDGDVDDTDLGVAISGFTGPLSPAAVPEPTSLALLTLGGLLVARRRRG